MTKEWRSLKTLPVLPPSRRAPTLAPPKRGYLEQVWIYQLQILISERNTTVPGHVDKLKVGFIAPDP
jgi:hypothetical protein